MNRFSIDNAVCVKNTGYRPSTTLGVTGCSSVQPLLKHSCFVETDKNIFVMFRVEFELEAAFTERIDVGYTPEGDKHFSVYAKVVKRINKCFDFVERKFCRVPAAFTGA